MAELAYNLESFNPAFTAVLLRVQVRTMAGWGEAGGGGNGSGAGAEGTGEVAVREGAAVSFGCAPHHRWHRLRLRCATIVKKLVLYFFPSSVSPPSQCTIGTTDYVRRDMALKKLIQPLAGEYGMHNDEPQGEGRVWGRSRVGGRGGAQHTG